MTTLKEINQYGLCYIALTIAEIVEREGRDEEKGHGMWIHNTWLTPESYYWLKKLLEEATVEGLENVAKTKLQTGTNLGLS